MYPTVVKPKIYKIQKIEVGRSVPSNRDPERYICRIYTEQYPTGLRSFISGQKEVLEKWTDTNQYLRVILDRGEEKFALAKIPEKLRNLPVNSKITHLTKKEDKLDHMTDLLEQILTAVL